jgi:hypothetical protein
MRPGRLTDSSLCGWVADNTFHAFAFVALQLGSPRQAHSWIKAAASAWPRIGDIQQARAVVRRLGNRGTCLSRALAVATRCAESQVVFGIARNRAESSFERASIQAHAWVEVNQVPLEATRDNWMEVGRLA